MREALASHLVLLIVALLLRGPNRWRHILSFGALAGGVLAFGAVANLLGGRPFNAYVLQDSLVTLLAGFTLMTWFWVAVDRADPAVEPPGIPEPRAVVPVLLIVAIAVLALVRAAKFGAFDLEYDEAVYQLQARWFSAPGFGPALRQDVLPHLARMIFGFTHDGRMYAQYPPGWPFAIAMANAAGLSSINLSIGVGALSIVLCYLVAREWLGWKNALACALLLITQTWYLDDNPSLMSNALTLLLALSCVLFVLRGRRSAQRQTLLFALAGLAAGWAVAARPLTGLAIVTGVLLWTWFATPSSFGQRMREAIPFCAGVVPPVLLLLAYNARTTGSPFVLGYTAVHGSLHSLGFGLRGFSGSGGAQFQFTPAVAVDQFATRFSDLAKHTVAMGLLVSVIATSVTDGWRPRWRVLLPFLPLPAGYFLYFFSMPRFYLELLPFLIIGWVALVARVMKGRSRALWAMVLVAAFANVFVAPHRDFHDVTKPMAGALSAVEQRGEEERLLVLLDPSTRRGNLNSFFALSGLPSDRRPFVLYGTERDTALMNRFPDRTPLAVRWMGAELPPEVRAVRREP